MSCRSLLACSVSVENQLVSCWKFPCVLSFSLVAFDVLFLSLVLVSLTAVQLVLLLGFVLPGALCASWAWSAPVLGEFSAVISEYSLRPFLPLSPPSGIPIM